VVRGGGCAPHLNFTGAGIVINGGSATITITNNGFITFNNPSTAGSATIAACVAARTRQWSNH
jgi:hypothetical protein